MFSLNFPDQPFDYSPVVFMDSGSILTKKLPSVAVDADLTENFRLFDWTFRYLFAVYIAVMIIFLAIVNYLLNPVQLRFMKAIKQQTWRMVEIWINNFYKISKSASENILITSISVTIFFCLTMYFSLLTTDLITVDDDANVNSLDDLVQSDLRPMLYKTHSLTHLFRTSNSGPMKRIWDKVQRMGENSSFLKGADSLDVLRKLQSDKIALIQQNQGLDVAIKTSCQMNPTNSLWLAKNNFANDYYAYPVRHGVDIAIKKQFAIP